MSFKPEFFNPEKCRNETEVESKFVVQYLLPALGYTPETWNQEITFGNMRLDFIVFAAQLMPINLGPDSPLSLVVEAKSPRNNLIPHVSKLKKYLTRLSAPYGLLTNGKDFRIFERRGQEIELVFQCKGGEVQIKLDQIRQIIGHEALIGRRSPIERHSNALNREGRDTGDRLNDSPTVQPSELGTSAPTSHAVSFSESPSAKPRQQESDSTISNARSLSASLPDSGQTVPNYRENLGTKPQPINSTQSLIEPQPIQGLTGEKRMKTIAVYHNKGGVGKTTTVTNLAAALSKQGKRVLIIDLDSQANTTFATGLVKFDDEANDDIKDSNILHVLHYEELFPLSEVVRPATFCDPVVQVVPSHIDLMGAESDLNDLDNSRMVLGQKLGEVENDYDFTIIDTPPSLNLYARIGLITADYLIIPSDLKPFANQGLKNVRGLIKNVNGFRRNIGKSPLKLLGVLATKISTNSRFRQSTLPKRMQTVMERYDFEVMETIIFEREALAKCSEKMTVSDGVEIPDPLSVLDFKPQSDAAREFNDLALEILRKVK
ncbi:MAG: AAA family ATPase [Microcystaceae cyanobacterium]